MPVNRRLNKEYLLELASNYTKQSEKNRLPADKNGKDSDPAKRIFEEPLLGVAAADNETFQALLAPEAIGPHFLPLSEWLPGAKSVLSFFLPMSKTVKETNAADKELPSFAWLYARVEGQQFIDALSSCLRDEIKKVGFRAVSPSLDERLQLNVAAPNSPIPPFSSNWSERHIAYVCGLGTFGLHTCLITERGTAGRFFSIVTDLELEPTVKNYSEILDYCIKCGACLKKCPVGALTESGKSNTACAAFMRGAGIFLKPRYGCGKCQTGVPCESEIPKKAGR